MIIVTLKIFKKREKNFQVQQPEHILQKAQNAIMDAHQAGMAHFEDPYKTNNGAPMAPLCHCVFSYYEQRNL